jgi:hypothetical protein
MKARISSILWGIFLFLSIILINGCETTKGMVTGAQKDTKNIWQGLVKTDNWLKKNLW